MKKNMIFIFLVTFVVSILSIGCSNKMEEWEVGIYLADLNTNTSNTVFITYTDPFQVEWAMDGKHFAVIEDVLNRRRKIVNSFVRVFETESNKEIKIPPELNDNKIKSRSLAWVDNESLVIGKLTLSTKDYFFYSLKDTEVKRISEQQAISYKQTIRYQAPGEEELKNHYYVHFQDDLAKKITKKIGTEYVEGIMAFDESKVIFSTESKNAYIYDINTEEITYLFDGVDLVLSPKETKIAYTVPKGQSMQEFNRYGTFESTSMETWIYDLQKGKATKLADFYAKVFFSPNDRYIIYYPITYIGQPSA